MTGEGAREGRGAERAGISTREAERHPETKTPTRRTSQKGMAGVAALSRPAVSILHGILAVTVHVAAGISSHALTPGVRERHCGADEEGGHLRRLSMNLQSPVIRGRQLS